MERYLEHISSGFVKCRDERDIILWPFQSTIMDKKAASADPPAEVGDGGGGGGGGGGDPAQDPRNVAELTHYIQSMLQQMQDRWLTHHFGPRNSLFI